MTYDNIYIILKKMKGSPCGDQNRKVISIIINFCQYTRHIYQYLMYHHNPSMSDVNETKWDIIARNPHGIQWCRQILMEFSDADKSLWNSVMQTNIIQYWGLASHWAFKLSAIISLRLKLTARDKLAVWYVRWKQICHQKIDEQAIEMK